MDTIDKVILTVAMLCFGVNVAAFGHLVLMAFEIA